MKPRDVIRARVYVGIDATRSIIYTRERWFTTLFEIVSRASTAIWACVVYGSCMHAHLLTRCDASAVLDALTILTACGNCAACARVYKLSLVEGTYLKQK